MTGHAAVPPTCVDALGQGGHTLPLRDYEPQPTSCEIAEQDGGAQVIGGSDYQRLWRLAYATELLARLPSEAAELLGIQADHTSSVAQFIAEDLTEILNRSVPADE